MTVSGGDSQSRQKLFDAICTTWEGAVASGLPHAEDLNRELARLQQWCGIEENPSLSSPTTGDSKGVVLGEF